MATFKRFKALVGSPSSAPSAETVYTVPASKTSVITGLTVSNVSDYELPCDVFISSGGTDYYIAMGLRIAAGEQKRLTGMEKMVLETADAVKSDAPTVDGGSTDTFVVWLSIYEDV